MIIIIGEKSEKNCQFDSINFQKINIPPYYYKGAEQDTIKYLEKVIERRNGELSFAERGCVRAHWIAYKYIFDNHIGSSMIMEDDATFSKFGDNDRLERAYKKFLASDYHIGIIGVSRLNNRNIKYFNFKYSNILGLPKKDEFVDNINLNYCGTVGYFIKKEACEKILENFEEPYWRADNWDTYRSLGLKVAVYNPVLVIENTRQSTIENSLELMNSLFKKHGVIKEIAHLSYIKIRTLILK